jgi:hypothetical protein
MIEIMATRLFSAIGDRSARKWSVASRGRIESSALAYRVGPQPGNNENRLAVCAHGRRVAAVRQEFVGKSQSGI